MANAAVSHDGEESMDVRGGGGAERQRERERDKERYILKL